MTIMDGFTPVAEVTADDRARLPFGRAGVHKDDRFALAMNADGAILLTPVVSIPARELIIWEDDDLRASLIRGLQDSAAGRVQKVPGLLDDDPDGE